MNQENYQYYFDQEISDNGITVDLTEGDRETGNHYTDALPYNNAEDVRMWYENHQNMLAENLNIITIINPVPFDHPLYQWSNGYALYSFPTEPQLFVETQANLSESVFQSSDDEDSISEFSDTESSSVEMMEIPDGENVWLLDEGENVILTSDFSSGEEWTLEE